MAKNILIYGLPYTDYLPLVRAIAGQGFNLFMSITPLTTAAEAAGVRFRRFEACITPEIEARAQQEVARISTGVLEIINGEMAHQAFSSPLGNFLPLTGQAFFNHLMPMLTMGIVLTEAVADLLNLGDLCLALLDCDNDCGQRTLVNYLKLQGVPSLHLAHGLYSKPQVHVAGELDRLNSDYLAVFGARARDNYLHSGNPPERVFLTGNPLWDPLYAPAARISTREARRRLGLDPDRPVVLFCSSYAEGSSAYFRHRAQRMFAVHEAIIEAVRQLGPQVQLIVRPHPTELRRAPIAPDDSNWVMQAYQRWLAQNGVPGVHLSGGHKIEAIRAADMVIVADQSSMIPEAMILQKPTIMLTLLKDFDTTYTEADGIIVVDEKEQLAGVIDDLITSPSAREAMVQRQNAVLPELNHGHDGRATERVADLVRDLASRTPAGKAAKQLSRPSSALHQEQSLNLLFAAHNFLPYSHTGTEIYTHDLARAMLERGHRVKILYTRPGEAEPNQFALRNARFEDLPVIEVLGPHNMHELLKSDALKNLLRRFLKQESFHLVHAQHLMGLTISFLEVLQELHIPIILTLNDFWLLCQQIHLVSPEGTVCEGPETIDKCAHCMMRRIGELPEEQIPQIYYFLAERDYLHQKAIRLPDLALCPSRFLMRVYQQHGLINGRMIHHPQGANLLTPRDHEANSTSRLRIAYLGSINYRKGLDLFITAFNKMVTDKAELHIWGEVLEPPYFEAIMQAVPSDKPVTYHGGYKPQDLPGILARTDVAVVPSRGENYPFVIREILHAGVPVVASRVAGIPEIIHHDENGLLFEENSADDLARSLKILIDDPGKLAALRAGIRPMKSITQDAAEIEQHYRDVLSRKSRQEKVSSRPARLKVGFLAREAHANACVQIRLKSPLTHLHQSGHLEHLALGEACFNDININMHNFNQLDVFIVQRQVALSLPFQELYNIIKDTKLKIVYEIDDALTDLPEHHPDYESVEKKYLIEEYINNADLVTVTTKKLQELYSNLNQNIVILPNCLDLSIWKGLKRKSLRDDNTVRILFSGTLTHVHDLEQIEEAIIDIITEYGDRVRFLFWGDLTNRLRTYPQVREVHKFVSSYWDYAQKLRNLDVDFAVVPLADNLLNQSKSRIKWLEYSICRIPGIFSNIGEYNTSIEPMKTGLLVDNNLEEWRQAIKLFIDDKALRTEIAEKAYDEVVSRHTLDQNAHRWLAAYRSLFSHPQPAAQPAPDLVSIIIPVLNNLDYTRQCLEAIYQNTGHEPAYEIIVVDNGSTDGTGDFLEQEQAAGRLKVLSNPENLGFARACNQGAQATRGSCLLFLNNDTQVLPGWLTAMTACLKRDVGVVGAKLLYPDDSVQHAGVVFNQDKRLLHIYKNFSKDHPAVNKEREFQAVTAACMLIRKSLFDEIGPFDESYFNGLEDVDLCLNVKKLGYKVLYTPKCEVYHFESKTPGRFAKEPKNSRLFLERWYHQIVPDEETYFQEDGMKKEETILEPSNEIRLIIDDCHENPHWIASVRWHKQGMLKEAVECYEKALKFNPFDRRNVRIANELADLLELMGNYPKAAHCWKYILKTAPSPQAHFRLGKVFKKLRQLQEAIEQLETARNLIEGSQLIELEKYDLQTRQIPAALAG